MAANEKDKELHIVADSPESAKEQSVNSAFHVPTHQMAMINVPEENTAQSEPLKALGCVEQEEKADFQAPQQDINAVLRNLIM